tara:strand:+ start:411 stop:980 length:570 start_codon:yes stop_codon:yes gene_type:complete
LNEDIEETKDSKILLIEPVEYNLKELKERTNKNPNIIIEEIAISDKNEIAPFYYVKRSSMERLKKHWSSGIGSFNKDHLLNHRSKNFKILEEDIESFDVKCLSFSSLIKKYSITSIGKLLIDVEGAESKIMNSINFKEVLIENIIFEKKHFDGPFKMGPKLEKIKSTLIENNYELLDLDKENILAKKIR